MRERPGTGVGTRLLHILIKAVAACRAVVVNALNADAYRRWRRFGFIPFDPDDEENFDVYLPTADITGPMEAAEP